MDSLGKTSLQYFQTSFGYGLIQQGLTHMVGVEDGHVAVACAVVWQQTVSVSPVLTHRDADHKPGEPH